MSVESGAGQVNNRANRANVGFCPKCGAVSLPERTECPVCRAPSPSVAARSRSRNLTVLLSLILGGIGAHKFYLGMWGWGIVYIAALPFAGISVLVGIAEAAHFHAMPPEEFDLRYNKRKPGPFDW
ncbi:MAG TPA: NINE protein [Candidatus Brocadiia bacterium]|nr:NINE protein [Candidatus Brocadiia bacterium]